MIHTWGVRSRVVLVAVLPMLVVAVLLTAFYTNSRLADFEEAYTTRGKAFARQLAAASEYAVFSGNRETLEQLVDTTLTEDGVLGVAIVDRYGLPLLTAGQIDEQTLPYLDHSPSQSRQENRDSLRVIEQITANRVELQDDVSEALLEQNPYPVNSPQLGQVLLDLSYSHLHARRNELLRAGAITVLLVLLGTLILAIYMSSGVSGPIRRIARAVERIGQGSFEERVPPVGGGSLKSLAIGVNNMAAQLASAHEDMSKRINQATAELRTRKEEAERANMAKSRFLAAASHDLRQPMHALSLFIAELSQHRLSRDASHLLDQISTSAQAVEDLLDSLLDISKLDAGVLCPSPRPFPLQPVFDRVEAAQRPAARERGLALRLRQTAHWGLSDPVLFERVLSNLVSNAVRYTRHGSVLVACRRRGDQLRIEVRDSGIGIPPESQEIIFQEFVQLANPERARGKGLGLGLAIVRRLTDLLHHPLDIRSQPGKGSIFAVTLPYAPAESMPHAADVLRHPGNLHGLRIALIDNDPLALSGLSSLLRSWGCDIVSAASRAQLLRQLENAGQAPQIIISDFRLGGTENGIMVVRAVRERYGATLPAAIISGDTGADTQALVQGAGLPLLHKPLRPARLRALLNRVNATTD